MQRRKKSVDYGVEIFMTNGGENFQTHALEFKFARADVMWSTINRHLVPARDQTRREMFGEGFEAAIVGGNASGSENRDPHG